MTMTMKERLEIVWNTPGCRCPNHLIRWNDRETGYNVWHCNYQGFWSVILRYHKGTRKVSSRGCKPKGKGFSFLPKRYGFYWLNSRKPTFPGTQTPE